MKKIYLLLLLTASSMGYALAQSCTTGCTQTISANSNTNVVLGSNQMLCITGGTYTGSIDFTGGGTSTICVAAAATFSPNNLTNNTGNTVIVNNYGIMDVSNSISLSANSQINNYNVARFRSNLNVNGAVAFYNGPNGYFQFDQSFQLQSNSTFTNDGYVRSLADLSTNNGTTLINNLRLRTDANFNPNSSVTNNGIVTAFSQININGGNFTNNCRMVANAGFNNSSANTINNGFVWVPGGAGSATQIQINGAFRNNGYLRAPRISISAAINNTNGMIRIEGGGNTNESVNNGSITNGSIGDITNAALTPPYRFDVPGTLSGVTVGLIPAYDTFSTQFTNNCGAAYMATLAITYAASGNVFQDVNGLNDNTVNGTGIAMPSATQLYINVLNAAGTLVVATTAVSNAMGSVGAYSFAALPAATYIFQLSTVQGSVNGATPATTLPTGWVFTAENVGTGMGNDGLPADGRISVAIGAATPNINFGIQQPPVAANASSMPIVSNGYTQPVPATNFAAPDPDGTTQSIRITSFPTNAQSITINGFKYFSNSFPVAGVIIPSNAMGNPTQSIGVIPTGLADVVIPFVGIDNANRESTTIASVTVPINIILPITLSGFKVQVSGCQANLVWQTSNELNSAHFDIEKSIDGGQTFSKIGVLAAAGNSSTPLAYSFANSLSSNTLHLYRLRLVDKNGSSVYSDIKQASCSNKTTISIYPNPVKNRFTIAGTLLGDKVNVVDENGRVLKTTTAAEGFTPMDVANLLPGVYTVQVTSALGIKTNSRLVKL